jgi:NAD(P)-dependent dehydrogenase (short-subunit alcohol dehydrogenase family)
MHLINEGGTMDLNDKVIVVTGGGQGIGKGIALRLLQEGARVIIAELDAEAGEETAREYAALGAIRFVKTDTADEAAVQQMIEQTIETFGRLDGLVNNAGIAEPGNTPVEELSLENWNRMLAVNLTGYFLCAKHAVPHLRESGGAIVNISSTRSLQSEPDTEAYSATKGGVDALTHALAVSLGPQIRVNAILPGWIVVTEWKKGEKKRKPDLSPADHAQHPAGRVGYPEDIAALCCFLLSKEAGFITGQRFVLDGGMTVKMMYE